MRHFSRRYFAKLLAAPLTASIVQIAKSDESEAKGSPNVKASTAKTSGPLHVAILTNYVKPNQRLFSKNKLEESSEVTQPFEPPAGTAVIFVQLVSLDSNNTAYIQYKILDRFDTLGHWHDKGKPTTENKDSTIFSTTFRYTNSPDDLLVTPLPSGEVQITGHDANNHDQSISWVSSQNTCKDDDVTWVQQLCP
jgi:hypothetical protein